MIPVTEALSHILSNLKPVGHEEIPVADGLGRVLASDVAANLTYPPTDISAMDGYAVVASNTATCPVTLRQIGISQAGSGFEGSVSSGETARIFTGAPLPSGADAIVIQENTDVTGDMVSVREAVTKGTFVRAAGLDFTTGEILRPAGHRLSARDLGLLAASNVSILPVYKKPRVAYLATGDELVMPGEPLGPDQIISSNSIAMDAYIRAFGGETVSLGIAKDNEESLREALSGLGNADLLITIGGASVGDFDLVQSVLGGEGLELGFYKVAMRPGKPLIFGNLNGTPMLGLPGNPVSAGVTALLFVRPAISRLSGCNGESVLHRARLGRDLTANDQRQDYLRAALSRNADGDLVATPFEKQDSAMMTLLAYADCLIIRPPFAESSDVDSEVDIMLFGYGCDAY
ncbi:MAG: molybdopterin molybdotransferase MoeA [Rhodospirillales bacterium]|nr:molybdopterin molybdotransferase MoeA [Rhodospirillales bacterium]